MEKLRLTNPNGVVHLIIVSIEIFPRRIKLIATYNGLQSNIAVGTQVAHWTADYISPIPEIDLGQVAIGRGRIDLDVSDLQGIGLGSLLMLPLVRWIKQRPIVPVVPINLSVDDASTDRAKNIRNRFYEKLGFVFDYHDEDVWGESREMTSDRLEIPKFGLSRGWHLESVAGIGSVF